MKAYDVIVIGSGLVGVASAYELAKAGRSVALLDSGGLSAGASAANTGLLLFEGLEAGVTWDLCMASLERFKHLEQELEMPFGFGEMNFLGFFTQEQERAVAEKRKKFYEPFGFRYELLSPEEVRSLEPALHLEKEMGGAYYTQWVMDPLRLVYAYFRKAVQLGTQWYSHTKAVGFEQDNGRIRGVITDKGEVIRGKKIVVAAGAWSTELLKSLHIQLPQFYIQGACMVMERSKMLLRHTVSTFTSPRLEMEHRAGQLLKEGTAWEKLPELNANEFIIVPDTNGNHLVAQRSCISPGWIQNVPHEFLRDMCRNVSEYFPALRQTRVIRSWITPVPFVPDGNPFWGALEPYNNVIMATGFGSVLIMAPMIGTVTKELVLGEPVKYDLAEFDPNRSMKEMGR